MSSKDKYELGIEMYVNEGISINEISKKLKISSSRFSKYLKQNNIEVKRNIKKNKVDSCVFEKIDSNEKAYWLGFMYADGYVISNSNSIGLALSKNDLNHIKKFKSFLKYEGGIRFRDKYKSVSIEFRDSKMKNDLIFNGCTPNKSLTLKFPDKTILLERYYNDFIRGYFDGDGCVCCTEKTKNVSMIGTYDFLSRVCEITNISKNRIYHLDNKSKQFRIMLSSKNDILCFLKYIYLNSNLFMERKYEKYINMINA